MNTILKQYIEISYYVYLFQYILSHISKNQMDNKMEAEKKLEDWHYKENDRIHTEHFGKVDFKEKIKELDEEFRKRFTEIFKK